PCLAHRIAGAPDHVLIEVDQAMIAGGSNGWPMRSGVGARRAQHIPPPCEPDRIRMVELIALCLIEAGAPDFDLVKLGDASHQAMPQLLPDLVEAVFAKKVTEERRVNAAVRGFGLR